MAYGRTKYGTGYYIYHQYVPGAPVSQPITSWTPEQAPPADVLALFAAAGTDLAPAADSAEGKRRGIKKSRAQSTWRRKKPCSF